MTKTLNQHLQFRCTDRIDEAKRVSLMYSRGEIAWDMAKKLVLRLGYLPETANGILLGTHHLPGE